MIGKLISLVGVLVLLFLLYQLLRIGNLPLGKRQQQKWNLWLVSIISLASVLIYFIWLRKALRGDSASLAENNQVIAFFNYLKSWIGSTLDISNSTELNNQLIVILFFLTAGFVFGLMKWGIKSLYSLFGTRSSNRSEETGVETEVTTKALYLANIFKQGLNAGLVLLGVALLGLLLEKTEIRLSPILILVLLIILEWFWFYDRGKHEMAEEEKEQVEVEEADYTAYFQEKKQIFKDLWDEYQKIWSENSIGACHIKDRSLMPSDLEVENSNWKIELSLDNASTDEDEKDIIKRMEAGEDLIIELEYAIYEKVAFILAKLLVKRVTEGNNVLVLGPHRIVKGGEYTYYLKIKYWLEDIIYRYSHHRRNIEIFEGSSIQSSILISSAQNLLEWGDRQSDKGWFNRLQTVIILEGDKAFAEQMNSGSALMNIFRLRNKELQVIVLSNYQKKFQPAVMRNLNVQKSISEHNLKLRVPKERFSLFWKTDGASPFQSKVFYGAIDSHIVEEDILALLAWREGIKNIQKIWQDDLPWDESLEEIQKHLNGLKENPIPKYKLKGIAKQNILYSPFPETIQRKEVSFLLVRDREFNLVTAANKWESSASIISFLHVVSPPYLLRDYFMDNLLYFRKAPVHALACEMMLSRYQIASKLLFRMVQEPLEQDILLNELSLVNSNVEYVKKTLVNLFLEAFNIDLEENSYLKIKKAQKFKREERNFKEVIEYGLRQSIMFDPRLHFLKDVKISDLQHENILHILPYDFLFQNYLPKQIRTFHGKPYEILNFQEKNFELKSTMQDSKEIISYRPEIEVTLLTRETPDFGVAFRHKSNKGIVLTLNEGTFKIKTKGYFKFMNIVSYNREKYSYIDLKSDDEQGLERHYKLGRLLCVDIDVDDILSKNGTVNDLEIFEKKRVIYTIAVLIKEIAYTLFPYSYQYLVTATEFNKDDLFSKEDKATNASNDLLPLSVVNNRSEEETNKKHEYRIYLFEDANQDMGLIQSVFENWEYVFQILSDYLFWIYKDESYEKVDPVHQEHVHFNNHSINKLDRLSFLKYGNEDVPAYLDLEKARNVIDQIIDKNPFTEKRKEFYNMKKKKE